MKVMVFVKANADSEAGKLGSREMFEEMGRYNDELQKAGIMISCDGLKPSSEAVRVHFSGKERSVSKGPFKNPDDIVAGYWLWEVKSMDEAVEWVKRCPNPMISDSDIDIRPVFEAKDVEELFK